MEENAAQTPVSPSPVSHNPAPPRKKNYSLWIIAGIFLLLLVGTGTYFLGVNSAKPLIADHISPTIAQVSPSIHSPTSDPRANWKTYTNTKYSFTVQYPAKLVLTDGKTDQGTFENSNSVLFNEPGVAVGLPAYYISVIPDISSTSRDSSIYNSVSGTDIAKVFALSMGQSLDMQTTQDFGGDGIFPLLINGFLT